MIKLESLLYFFFNDTATTEIYTLSPTRRSSDLALRRAHAETFLRLAEAAEDRLMGDRKSTRLNSSHRCISYAVFCLKKKKYESRQERSGRQVCSSTSGATCT